MKCFYHKSDLDGHCSGAIIKEAYPDCEMIGVDYDDELDRDNIFLCETVYVVDFSFPRPDMIWLQHNCDLRWIDHHKTAIEKMEGGPLIMGIRDIGKAGCELTWMYIHDAIESQIPEVVKLLGRYDVWDHSNVYTLPFQYGMRSLKDTRPGAEIWHELLISKTASAEVDALIEAGQAILDYENLQNEKYARSMAYEKEFHGYRALVMNKPFSNSKVFDSVYDPGKHDIMVLFGVIDGKFKYTLYCNKPEIDVSKIAVEYGGGGHAGAAGFYLGNLII